MQFSSYGFIFIFMPIAMALYYIVGKHTGSGKLQRLLLTLFSAVFVLSHGVLPFCVLAASLVINLAATRFLCHKKSRIIFGLALVCNIALLCYYKYFSPILPLGISFFTFSQIEYLCHVYKGEEAFSDPLGYVNYISFFPRLSSGPLVDPKTEAGDFYDCRVRLPDADILGPALYLFAMGLFKKVVIADTLGLFVDAGYGISELSAIQAWALILIYPLQIYFDFSGYSDMAMALAAMLGYELPVNFDSPYHAAGVGEYWGRWHISLSHMLMRLVYIPLGGNRKGRLRTYINLMTVFLVSGFWHGNTLSFVLWGLCHGAVVCLERIFKKSLGRIPGLIRVLASDLTIALLFVIFRAGSLTRAKEVYLAALGVMNAGKIADLGKLANDGIIPFPDMVWAVYLLAVLAFSLVVVANRKNSVRRYREFCPSPKMMVLTSAMLVFSVIHLSRLSIFVYTNF